MRRFSLICAGVGLILVGCSVFTHSKTGDWPEPHEYSRHWDEAYTRNRAEKRALVALANCHPGTNSDFRQGFIQAYVDIALGASGALPPVPPERYWKACQRDPQGYCEANDWFTGYSAGAQRALNSNWHAHNQVPASGTYCR
jgi:hypothetical protein